ncbi:MAG TPA: hypothetical protein VIH48_00695 [Candidatus Bathyarchaeia archaeon]
MKEALKGFIRDLLIVTAVFVALNAFNSTVLAVPDVCYVAVWNNRAARDYRSIRGNQTRQTFTVYNATASYVCLYRSSTDFFCAGFAKGYAPNGTWLSVPYYYVDWNINGYNCLFFEQAPAGSYDYMLFVFSHVNGSNTMYAFIDSNFKTSVSGFSNAGYAALGATETHDTRDQMNHWFSNMRAGEDWCTYSSFTNPLTYEDDPPYNLNLISASEWTATGQGS